MKNGFVSIKVYDVQGREVSTLVNEYKHAGSYDITFSSNSSVSLPSGIYFYKLVSGDFTEVKKMTLIK